VPLSNIIFAVCIRIFGMPAPQSVLISVNRSWPRAARADQKSLNTLCDKLPAGAAALIFHEKHAPTFCEWAAIQLWSFEFDLLTPGRLLPSRACSLVFLQATKKETTVANATRETAQPALVPACGGTPRSAADSATLRS
jgi:hypothetical protein